MNHSDKRSIVDNQINAVTDSGDVVACIHADNVWITALRVSPNWENPAKDDTGTIGTYLGIGVCYDKDATFRIERAKKQEATDTPVPEAFPLAEDVPEKVTKSSRKR